MVVLAESFFTYFTARILPSLTSFRNCFPIDRRTPLGIVSQFTDNKVFSEKFVSGGSFSISPVISLNQ